MRDSDLKKFIYSTKRPLTAVDVKKIISAVTRVSNVVTDKTGEHSVSCFYEGPFPLPRFPESDALALVDFGDVNFDFRNGFPKSEAELATVISLFECLPLSKICCCSFQERSNESRRSGMSVEVLREHGIMKVALAQALPVEVPIQTSSLAKLLASGGWPVAVQDSKLGLSATHKSGGKTEFRVFDRRGCVQLVFDCPGWSARKIASHVSQTFKAFGYRFKYGDWSWVPSDGEIRSFKDLNRSLSAISRSGIRATCVRVNQIDWRLTNFHAFAAMAKMHALFPKEDAFTTRLFEFEFAGQLGFMELGHEKKGFRAWFSFDEEKPFEALAKAIGHALVEYE